MNRSYFVLVLLAVAAVLGSVLMTRVDVRAFIDLPSLAVVLLFPVIMSFASHAPREIGRSYRVAFRSADATRVELDGALAYFDGLARHLVCGGALGVSTGFIAVLGFVGLGRDPEAVGKGLALTLLSAFYAVVLVAVVAVPFRTAIRRRIAELAA